MKFTSSCIIVGAALLSFAGPASADLKETENALEKIRNLKYIPKHKLQENGAAEFGYGMAKVMFDKQHGGRCFGGLNSVINDFWPAVEDEVLETCYDRYCTLWPERAMDCADGAETFVQDLADQCIDKQDCDELGDLAAFEVSGIFCFSRAIQGRKKNFFPPLCRNRAKNVCEDIAVDITKELIWKKQCSDDKKLDYVEEQKLKANCGVVVKDLSQTAELERRNGYGYDACKRYNDNLGPDPYGNDPDPYYDNNGNHYGNDPDPYYDNNGSNGNHYGNDPDPYNSGNSGKHDNDPYYDDNRNKYDTTELP